MGLLDDYYQQSLGRSADAAGKAYWQNEIDSGKMTQEQVKDAIYNSAEATQRRYDTGAGRAESHQGANPYSAAANPSNDVQTSVQNLYRTNLGREADQAGLEYWTNEANTKGMEHVQSAFGNTFEARGYNSYQQPEPRVQNPAPAWSNFGPESRDVNAETDTVQGQLNGLLSAENPLMQRAYYKGLDYANGRGMLNSSVGAEAAQAAMMDVALPIAQQDAQTYYDQGKTNQAYQNQFNLNDRSFLQSSSFTANQAALDRSFQQAMTQADQIFQQNQMDREVYANYRGQLTTAVQDLVRTTSINISEIQTSPNISAEDKATMITQQQELLQSLTSTVSGLYSESELWQQGWSNYLTGGA